MLGILRTLYKNIMENRLTNARRSMPSFDTKNKMKAKVLEINKAAMEFLQDGKYEKCLKSIDKANHLIEFQFPYTKNSISGKTLGSYLDLVYRFQLVSVTYNN